MKDKPRITINLDAEGRERLIHAARGLTLKEAENVFAKTLVLDGKLDADDISVVFSEKQQIIRKSGMLEYYESQERFADGRRAGQPQGLAEQAERGVQRAGRAVRPARAQGRAAAGRAGLRQEPLRQGGLQPVEAAAACGSTSAGSSAAWSARARRTCAGRSRRPRAWPRRSSGSTRSTRPSPALQGSAGSDGGTASRVFGTFLTWLSEKTAPVFVIATANDISQLAAGAAAQGTAWTRSSSSICPTRRERREILRIHLGQAQTRPRASSTSTRWPGMSDGFSGAEIEEAIISGLFDAFSQGSDLDTARSSRRHLPRPCRSRRP